MALSHPWMLYAVLLGAIAPAPAPLISVPSPAALPATDLAALVRDTPAGDTLRLARGQVFRLTQPVTITRPITIEGQGATVIAADGAALAAMIQSTGTSGVAITDLSLDANVDRGGADYGIVIRGGDRHRIVDVVVRNTGQSCILLEDASGTINGNTAEDCGRDLTIARGTAANDHGIMVAALTRPVRGVAITGNVVRRGYRKGITTYARAPGALSGITVTGNQAGDCGLGGFYLSNAPGSAPQQDVVVSDNRASGNYVNFQVNDVRGLAMRNNRSGPTGRDGRSGAEGVIIQHVADATIAGMVVDGSSSGGILVRDSTGVDLVSPWVRNANGGQRGFAPGIHFARTRNSRARDVTIIDDRAIALTTHGFIEDEGSGANTLTVRRMNGVPRAVTRSGG